MGKSFGDANSKGDFWRTFSPYRNTPAIELKSSPPSPPGWATPGADVVEPNATISGAFNPISDGAVATY
jgi:hypothetical protein